MCTHLNDDAILPRFSEQIWPQSNCGISALKVEQEVLNFPGFDVDR